MRECKKCRAKNADEAKYCASCGSYLGNELSLHHSRVSLKNIRTICYSVRSGDTKSMWLENRNHERISEEFHAPIICHKGYAFVRQVDGYYPLSREDHRLMYRVPVRFSELVDKEMKIPSKWRGQVHVADCKIIARGDNDVMFSNGDIWNIEEDTSAWTIFIVLFILLFVLFVIWVNMLLFIVGVISLSTVWSIFGSGKKKLMYMRLRARNV